MIDDKDFKILELLKSNAKLTTKQISKKTLLPITTVHNRIKKLENLGVIKNYSVVIDHKKIGKTISAYVLMNINYVYLKEKKITQHQLAQQLSSHPFVDKISMVTGETDMILKVIVNDVSQLDDFVTKYLRNIDGVQRTKTMLILNDF